MAILAEPLEYARGGSGLHASAIGVSIFADRAHVRNALREDAEAAGLGVRHAETLDRLHDDQPAVLGDIVVVDVPQADAAVLAGLARLDMRAARSQVQLVVSTTQDCLDAVFGCLDQSGAQILVSPAAGERAIAMGNALALLPGGSLQELSGEDRVALMRLTEQVNQLAQRIEGLSDDDGRAAGREESKGAFAETPQADLPSSKLVREIIRQRQLRARFFDENLFADPAWDILLDLTAAHCEERPVSVSSLCIAASVPSTTALRWIGQMTQAGLLERASDPQDRRRAFIRLSEAALQAMAKYFKALGGGAAVI